MIKNILTIVFCCTVFCCTVLSTVIVFGQVVPNQVNLFEKTNLSEWDFHTDKEGVTVEKVYSFSKDGILTCQGEPFGWLGTKEEYKNFKLSIDYCWPSGVKPTNSGIFIRLNRQPEQTFLPRCIEVQLASKSAGDLYGFHGMKLPVPEGAVKGRDSARDGGKQFGFINGLKKIADREKEPGQWNTLDILCSNGLIVIVVNGSIVNWVTNAEQIPGKIGFQSEGGLIEFRRAVLTVLP
ncbi:MAG: DUF1080 domain-containing protein [Planctomycetaceae bacterium]|jgi:hypothetical protein|nr:DUF1080 domain-containing protein [Planctomycetaceae bacterium]